jgi:histone H1-like protein Hc1
MSIKDTYKHLKDLLAHITSDLEKSENGNKAASQRVRTGTVKLEKIAKSFRKESISHEKKTKGTKKAAKPASSAKKGGHAPAKSASKSHAKAKHAPAAPKAKGHTVKAKPKAKAAHHAKTSVRSHHLSVKRATAKLPTKRLGHR